jgi:hypothetical protein
LRTLDVPTRYASRPRAGQLELAAAFRDGRMSPLDATLLPPLDVNKSKLDGVRIMHSAPSSTDPAARMIISGVVSTAPSG